MDRFSGIDEFVATVETGGFSAAANKLNVSRSAVGKSVQRLDERLGVRLFHRTTRVVKLTQEGHAFHEYCQSALTTLKAGEAALETGRLEPKGTVRLSVPVIFGRYCVAPVLYDEVAKHPGIVLEISFSDRPVDVIREGYDIVIRNGPLPSSSELMARALARQRMTVCAAPSYLASHGRPTTLADLAGHDGINYATSSIPRTWLFPDGHGKVTEVSMGGRIKLDDLEAMAQCAVRGLGLAWLPIWLVKPQIESGDLVPVLENLPASEFSSSAMWPRAPALP
jgi:DNA-binding transcriptional LysR family regulator